MRVVCCQNTEDLKRLMSQIKADSYGIKIMVPKALSFLIYIDSLPVISANVLKQEMLSLGADVAVSRDTLTGKDKKTACLLMATLSQYECLSEKLKRQPFGLANLGLELSHTLNNFRKDNFILKLGNRSLSLGRSCAVMGVINLTPDSFSGDGLLRSSGLREQKDGIEGLARKMVNDGADILDLGGESSRPQAKPVSLKEEIKRVIPAIKIIKKRIKTFISVDTSKPEVAKAALDSGAEIVNDISGLRNGRMAKVIASADAAVVVMHMKGCPQTMQRRPEYSSLRGEIIAYLAGRIKEALDAGIDKDKIIVDPGIGFGKSVAHNLELLKHLSEFKILGCPILVGTSRKSFIGQILGVDSGDRIFGTTATCVEAFRNGASMVRVHDVREIKQALILSERIKNV